MNKLNIFLDLSDEIFELIKNDIDYEVVEVQLIFNETGLREYHIFKHFKIEVVFDE